MPRSLAVTRANLNNVGEWKPGCRKFQAGHSTPCRTRVAENLINDVEFRTKLNEDEERMEVARRVMEAIPRVQTGAAARPEVTRRANSAVDTIRKRCRHGKRRRGDSVLGSACRSKF